MRGKLFVFTLIALVALLGGAARACRIPIIYPPHPIVPPPPRPPVLDPMETRVHKADIQVRENVATV